MSDSAWFGAVLSVSASSIGWLLLISGATKATHFNNFRNIVLDYRIVPRSTTTLFSALAVFTEVLCGVALLVRSDRELALTVSSGLFALFASAIAINVGRGRTYISCGCFGSASAVDTISWRTVARTVCLSLYCGACAWSYPLYTGMRTTEIVASDALGLLILATAGLINKVQQVSERENLFTTSDKVNPGAS